MTKENGQLDTMNDQGVEGESGCSWSYIKSVFTWTFIRKVVRTAMLVMTWISMGSFMELSGPTLIDFSIRMNISYSEVSGAISGRSIGKFIGVVLGGFLVDKFGRFCDLMLGVALTVAAVTTLCLPWVLNVDLLCFMYVVLGTCLGIINIAGQRIVLCIWLEKAASPMHIVHLGYGVGAFLAPLIANPFLADSPPVTKNGTESNSSLNSNQTLANNVTSTYPQPVSTIEKAYTIIAIATISIAVVFYLYQILMLREFKNEKSQEGKDVKGTEMDETLKLEGKEDEPNKDAVIDSKMYKKKSFIEMINPATCANGNCLFGSAILGFMFLRYVMYTGLDRNLGTFLRSYALDQLNFSKTDASILNSLFFIFYGVGRFVAFVVAVAVSIKVMLVVETFAMLSTALLSVIFARDDQTALWVLTGFSGFFIGPMYPSGIAWGNVHVEMTGLAMTWILLGSAIGGWSMLKFASMLYDTYGPPVFVYLSLGFCVALTSVDMLLTAISVLNSRKMKREAVAKKNDGDEDEQERLETSPL